MRHPSGHQAKQSVVAGNFASLDVSQFLLKLSCRKYCRKTPSLLSRDPVAPMIHGNNGRPPLVFQSLEVAVPICAGHVGTATLGGPVQRSRTVWAGARKLG